MTKQTIGQYRVGVSFNPSQNPLVDEIKRKAAELIDLIETIPHPPESERLHLAAVYTYKTYAAERVEEAAMWAVKAATKPAPELGD